MYETFMYGGYVLFIKPLTLCGPCGFLPFTQISSNIFRHPFLKILVLSKRFMWMPLENLKFSFTPSQNTLKYGYENRPYVRGLRLDGNTVVIGW